MYIYISIHTYFLYIFYICTHICVCVDLASHLWMKIMSPGGEPTGNIPDGGSSTRRSLILDS